MANQSVVGINASAEKGDRSAFGFFCVPSDAAGSYLSTKRYHGVHLFITAFDFRNGFIEIFIYFRKYDFSIQNPGDGKNVCQKWNDQNRVWDDGNISVVFNKKFRTEMKVWKKPSGCPEIKPDSVLSFFQFK